MTSVTVIHLIEYFTKNFHIHLSTYTISTDYCNYTTTSHISCHVVNIEIS